MLALSEIFFSIQGESTHTGLPCIFIRLAGCNLQCRYCDTKYSFTESFSLEVDDVINKISQYSPVALVEITGGEPLLQNNVYLLAEKLNQHKYKILLETNGSILLDRVPTYVTKIVDVKCPSSGHLDSFLIDNLLFLNKSDEIKFVISDFSDYLFAKDFLNANSRCLPANILFSNVATSLPVQELAAWILKDKLPVRLQIQLHKIIWGQDSKGV